MESFKESPTKKENKYFTEEEFERQFSQDHYLEIEGNDAIPYTTIVPEKPISENWVVYIGGFSQGKESYLDEIKDLAESGRKVLFTNPIKGLEVPEENQNRVDVPATILNKSRALTEILKEVGAEKVDLIGHSQGAVVITTFVAEHPGVANKMILECPAGLLEGKDSREKIMSRFAYDKTRAMVRDSGQVFSEAGLRAGRSFSKNLKNDFVFRLTEEIPGVTEVDIAPLLKEIKNREAETEVVLLNANNDKVFSVESIELAMGDNPEGKYIDGWAMYENKEASHSAPVVERAGILRQILKDDTK